MMARKLLVILSTALAAFSTVGALQSHTTATIKSSTSSAEVELFKFMPSYSQIDSVSTEPPCCRKCTVSTYTKTTNPTSPLITDCNAFADYLATHQGTWPLETLDANRPFRLGGVGLCRLAVTVSEPLGNGRDVIIGNLDALDIIRIALETLGDSKTGRVGAAGAFTCAGTYHAQVNWVLDSWLVGTQ